MTRAERRKNPDYRIAELEAEVERLREIAALHGRDALKYHDEVERLREENETLKVWLRLIADDPLRPYMAVVRAEMALAGGSLPDGES